LIVRALKDATPAVSGELTVPPSVHELVTVMLSAEPVPVVTVLPYWSSVETLNSVSATLSEAVAGGAVVKMSFDAPAGVTVIALLFAVPPAVVSVATSVHDVPVSMTTFANVYELAVAASEYVPPKVQELVIVSVSVVPVPPV
jgi:hypothetical protein